MKLGQTIHGHVAKVVASLAAISLISITGTGIATAADTEGQIDAANYDSMSGIQTVNERDGGDTVVGYINNGDSITFDLDADETGRATVSARVASRGSGGTIDFILDGDNIGSVSVPGTGGWDNYTEVTGNVNFSEAEEDMTLQLVFRGGGGYLFDINWFEFEFDGGGVPTPGPMMTPTPPRPPTPPTPPTPGGGSGIPSIITNGNLFDLEGGSPVVNGSSLVFDAMAEKVTTPNGNGWRHEYKIKSDERNALGDNYEEFAADIKVDMSSGGKLIAAQYHAGGLGTIMKLYVSDSAESGFDDSVADNGVFDVYVRMRNNSGVEEKYALGTIRSGQSFRFRTVNNRGVVSATAFGKTFTRDIEDSEDSYFKFGNYLQSQDPATLENCGSSGNSDSFSDCYDRFGITQSKVTMTNLEFSRD